MSSHKETEHTPATPDVAQAKKHKKKHSNTALRSIQELDTGWNKAALKIVKGVQEGLETYVHSSKVTSEKKASTFHEVIENHSKALRKALPIVAEAPADLLDSIADMKVVRDIFPKKDKDDDDDDE
jgi:uncharacterized protein YdaT